MEKPMRKQKLIGVQQPKPLNRLTVQSLILKELVSLLEQSNDLTFPQHLVLILRPKSNKLKEVYYWSDEELLLIIQNYRKELNDDPL
jgi:hypothetical protein